MRLLLTLTLSILLVPSVFATQDWNRFRGPAGSGVVDGPDIPREWSADVNLKWRTALPGKGVSSPIVNGDRVFLTAYTGYGLDMEAPGNPADLVRHLLAFDRATGEELWRFSIASTGKEDPFTGFITQHGYASSSPVTDGERVYVLFGKSGLFALTRDGEELWRKNLGTKSDPARWGDASSPILVDDVLVINAGILSNQVIGLDKLSGKTLWTVEDESFTNSWSTPAVYRTGDTAQIITHFPFKVLGIDAKTGETLWTAKTPLDDATSPSIVIQDDIAYLMGSRAGHAMAIRLGGKGDVSESHVLWQDRARAGIVSPVVVGKAMYWAAGGIFMAHDLATGERIYQARLPRIGPATGGFPNVDYSSPIAVGNHIVQFTRNGESYVIEATDEFKVVGHNAAFAGDDSAFSATPAVSNGELFIRSNSYLYCIKEEETKVEADVVNTVTETR
ncbi:MAG: PQQ-binding-like beta-propeller repeat protein [Acidobacteriota bacterium]